MCTVLKKLNPSFGYLEEVRKHLARLPNIDPATRTLILTGFPNVGKSSLMNNLTSAKVDVQSYPFTTQSLFVGHTVYKCVPWQVLDTPGLLDHPLEQRNTIEMQAITALAHLNACILYVIDISETCGYFLDQQISLFHSIKPLFKNKPMVLVLSKTDLKKWEDVAPESQKAIEAIAKEYNAYVISMSNKNGEGVTDLKAKACDILLDFRFAQKSENEGKMHAIENRLHVATPQKRDDKARPAQIPASVLASREKMKDAPADAKSGEADQPKKKTVKDIQEEEGGAGVFYVHPEVHFQLEDEDWKYDAPPEIFDGKNVADYIDPDIATKLDALDKEEAILDKMEGFESLEKTEEELKIGEEYKRVQGKKKILKTHHKLRKNDLVHKKAKMIEDVKKEFAKKGYDSKTIADGVLQRSSLVDKAKKRMKPEDSEKMEDVEGGMGPTDMKRKAVEKEEKMAFERAEGMAPAKSVSRNAVTCDRLRTS